MESPGAIRVREDIEDGGGNGEGEDIEKRV